MLLEIPIVFKCTRGNLIHACLHHSLCSLATIRSPFGQFSDARTRSCFASPAIDETASIRRQGFHLGSQKVQVGDGLGTLVHGLHRSRIRNSAYRTTSHLPKAAFQIVVPFLSSARPPNLQPADFQIPSALRSPRPRFPQSSDLWKKTYRCRH